MHTVKRAKLTPESEKATRRSPRQAEAKKSTPDPIDDSNKENQDVRHEVQDIDASWISDEDELLALPTTPGKPGNVSTPSKPTQPFQGGYDAVKSHNGQFYKGMQVGGSHVWNYQPGVWKETKEEPDLWKIDFSTLKKRAKNAPNGSGAPVGTEYHWLIVAHQYVTKTDANTYETHLVGSKYKLAHKNAGSASWSINTVKKQREREIELLDDAKRRIEGLPPVLGVEKVKVTKTPERGQKSLDSMFGSASAKGEKRKRVDG